MGEQIEKYFVIPMGERCRIDKTATYSYKADDETADCSGVYNSFPNAVEITKEQHEEICNILRSEIDFYNKIFEK